MVQDFMTVPHVSAGSSYFSILDDGGAKSRTAEDVMVS